ncbi:MAG: hypothetical protein GXY85_10085 [Candidatus Brocadiaceae bacterium]|nr:hypothetical protein [Candidatus Brocadiaceae bacterium]
MGGREQEVVYAGFTMDCLPAGGRGEVRGADRWDRAERSVAAFAEALATESMGGTFFIAPEALARFESVIADLRSGGCEAAMLCHPQLSGYQSYLGSYSFDRQREIISLARREWEQRLGEAATTVRPGFFSANDYTFHVFCMEGFTQGSCSLPGRLDGDQCSMWTGSYPFVRHTDPLDRTMPGTMEFLELPVTSDFQAASYITHGTYTPPHLRIEEPDVHGYARTLVERQIAAMEEEGVPLRLVNFVTSNLVGWGEPDDPHVERLHNLCAMLREVADQRNLRLEWAPMCELHAVVDRALGVGP